MNRLTKKSGETVWYIGGDIQLEPCEIRSSGDIGKILRRLAAYEDTGLEPNEVATLVKAWAVCYEDEVRGEACGYLGRELTDAEWEYALPLAKRKLDWIISREGDANGKRCKPYYLGKLVAERIREDAFNYIIAMCHEIMTGRRTAHEAVPAYT